MVSICKTLFISAQLGRHKCQWNGWLEHDCMMCRIQGLVVLAIAGMQWHPVELPCSNLFNRKSWRRTETCADLPAGLADPGPVASALWTDEELESDVLLDAIITVVDARNLRRQLADQPSSGSVNEAQQQIAYADVVLLNKVSRASCSCLYGS